MSVVPRPTDASALAGASAATTGRAGRALAAFVGARSPHEVRKALWGYVFISPWLLGFVFFVGGPLLGSLYLSFTEYDLLSAPEWRGLQNYRTAFTDDPLFWNSLYRTAYYAVLVVPLGLIGSLALAILLNQGLRGTTLWRTLFFLPHLTPAVAMAILWSWLLHPTLGPVNSILGDVGLGGFAWLTDKDTVIPSLIFISLWAGVGGNTMLIFLAALQGVPRELEEAAEIDGAGVWSKFRVITLPMITPTILFNLVLGVIASFQAFTIAFVATEGGPSYGSYFFVLHIYNEAFSYFRLAYGSALAWILLVLLLALTLANFAFSRRWVFYQGEK